MTDAIVYRNSNSTKLFTFKYCTAGMGWSGRKVADAIHVGYQDVLPEFYDNHNVHLNIILSGALFSNSGDVEDGNNSIDNQIYQLHQFLTNAHYLLKLRVYWSGASDYTDYTGHFSDISGNIMEYRDAATFRANFMVTDGYISV